MSNNKKKAEKKTINIDKYSQSRALKCYIMNKKQKQTKNEQNPQQKLK